MGSTFAAVHVKGCPLAEVLRLVDAELEESGATRLDPDAPETAIERRVLVFEDAGWVVVADEDQESSVERGEELALALSAALETDAIAINVFHSDAATLARFRRGDRIGSFEVPEGATRDEASGHARVSTRFLADLALAPEGRAELDAGLLADYTFPEATTHRAAELVGVTWAGAGARYLWADPPPGAKKLRYRSPEAEVAAPMMVDWRPPGDEGRDIRLSAVAEVAVCVGMPLEGKLVVDVTAHAGPRVDGLAVELRGPALALLDVGAVCGWNPVLDAQGGQRTEIVESPVERRGDALVARFPRAFVAPGGHAVLGGTSAAAFRAWTQALHAQSNNRFLFRLQAAARTAGSGDLEVTLTNLAGDPLDATPARVRFDVTPAPRVPLLPVPPDPSAPHVTARLLEDVERYGGDAFVCGWIGFDAPFAEVRGWLFDAASALGRWLARGAPLQISITAAGTHPQLGERFGAEDHLASDRRFALVEKYLAVEADVRLHAPFEVGANDPSFVRLRHQPDGTTIFEPAMRASLVEQGRMTERIVPVDLLFALPRPGSEDEARALGDRLDGLFAAAADLGSCVGGFAGPAGEAPWDDVSAYEQVAGTHFGHDHVDVVSRHARSPGWRVVVPRAATPAIESVAGVTRADLPAGALLRSSARHPFAMTDADREAVERAVLGCLRVPPTEK